MKTEKRSGQGKWKSTEEQKAELAARQAELEDVINEIWMEGKNDDANNDKTRRIVDEARAILGEGHTAVIRLREITRQANEMQQNLNTLLSAAGRLCAEIVLEARHKQRGEARG